MEAAPSGFRAFVARTFGDEGRAWLASLPALLDDLSVRWRLRLGPELAGGRLSYVCEVVTADGTPAVLKVGPPWPRVNDEITALRAWNGSGAPSLLRADGDRHALLLERISPGSHPDPGAADDVAGVLAALHVQPPPGLPPLGETVGRRLSRAAKEGRASEEKLAWARTTVDALERDPPAAVLLHGDFDDAEPARLRTARPVRDRSAALHR